MTTPKRDNAGRQPGAVGKTENIQPANPTKKIDRIEAALHHPAGLNLFEAERIGDHCLNSTVAALRERGIAISSRWEVVPTRYNPKGVRVLRYWIAEGE